MDPASAPHAVGGGLDGVRRVEVVAQVLQVLLAGEVLLGGLGFDLHGCLMALGVLIVGEDEKDGGETHLDDEDEELVALRGA